MSNKKSKPSPRRIEYIFTFRKWAGCEKPKRGDLLSVDWVYLKQYNRILEKYHLRVGEMVAPFMKGSVNGWYKLENLEVIDAEK